MIAVTPPRRVRGTRPTLVLGLCALVAACSSEPTDTPGLRVPDPPQPATPVTTAISAAQVANATIAGVFPQPVTFDDGAYEGAPFAPGSAVSPMAVLMTQIVALGELDVYPGADAAALIASNEGGSGERITLAIVGLSDGKAVSVATSLVGDRTKVRDLRISGRDIVLDVIEIGPGEAACCGTQLATKVYRLEGTTLTLVTSQVTGRKSLETTVAGPTWTAVALDGASIQADRPAPTLTFTDGRFSGSSGCHAYAGPVTEPKPGTITVRPATVARRTCAGAAMQVETRFLETLAKATDYTFLAGRLVVSGLDGDQMRTITFRR
jgi:heat shock protein HslJ